MGRTKKKFYAVVRGRNPGIYTEWFGDNGAEVQVNGFSGPVFKGFRTLAEAKTWMENVSNKPIAKKSQFKKKETSDKKPKKVKSSLRRPRKFSRKMLSNPDIVIYTDGGCINNPGPGGYGAVIISDGRKIEITGGFRKTTNNRMELMACIEAIENVEPDKTIALYSDSKYVVYGITKGWAKRWRKNNWMRTKEEPAKNSDLWKRLLSLSEQRIIDFTWVKGHANNKLNERCDYLAKKASSKKNSPPDKEFEAYYYNRQTESSQGQAPSTS